MGFIRQLTTIEMHLAMRTVKPSACVCRKKPKKIVTTVQLYRRSYKGGKSKVGLYLNTMNIMKYVVRCNSTKYETRSKVCTLHVLCRVIKKGLAV